MDLFEIINQPTTEEFKRLYHGRGEKTYPFLTIDSIDETLFIQFYEKVDEKPFLEIFKKAPEKYKNIIVKRRYENEKCKVKSEKLFALRGIIPNNAVAIENGIKFKLNFYNQNIGYFGDAKNARIYVEKISKDKKVLNLFAYTCGFSLFARRGGAKYIANVDMNKSVLAIGLTNHRINSLEIKNISFLPYNILKSFNKLKKQAPYDIIIIDPPTFQKGSFIASKDYAKIIKKLHQLSYKNTTLLGCINDPKITKKDFISLIEENTEFKVKEEITPPKEYKNSTLKSIVFTSYCRR
ncbi:class I SAM-dependent methyltransferase [Caminibacter sp.]